MQHHPTQPTRRRGLAILIAALLVAALVPFAAPVAAQPAPPPDLSEACEHAGSAGFTDVAGTGFADVIDCLAAFGVTAGTTATTYAPAVQVRRSQMALFYFRIGELAGVEWDTSDAGFGDLRGLGDDFVDAVNALANAGVISGTSATTFDPQARIRRSQMALFIDRFQEVVSGFRYSDGLVGDDLFPDISTLGAEARAAVNGIGSVGITQGDAAGHYVPNGFVSRQQMAAFIVRHLAENGWSVPAPSYEGTLIYRSGVAGADYVISTGSEIVLVTYEPGDTFHIDGVPATQGAFEAAVASIGGFDLVGHPMRFNPDTREHHIAPYDVIELSAAGWMVGYDLDLDAPASFDLVEPYSGAVIMGVDVSGADIFRLGNSTVTEQEWVDALNAGDTVSITMNADDEIVYHLRDGALTGTVDAGGGLVWLEDVVWDGPGLDDWSDAGNNLNGQGYFRLSNTDQHITIDGAPYNAAAATAAVEAAVADPDVEVSLVYTRADGIERFVFTRSEPAADDDPVPGTGTGTFVGGSVIVTGPNVSFQILMADDTTRTVYVHFDDMTVLVDNTLVANTELATTAQAGATVTITVPDETLIDDTQIIATLPGSVVVIDNP